MQSAMRPRGEEMARRVEALLAAGTSRGQWLGSHLAVSLAGSACALAAGGLGTGLAYGLVIGDLGQSLRLTVAALSYLPAVCLLVGITIGLYGIAPRWAVAAWGVLGACFVIGMFAALLDLPAWLVNLSPFDQTPQVPAAAAQAEPLLIIGAIALAFAVLGMVGFRRRDIGQA